MPTFNCPHCGRDLRPVLKELLARWGILWDAYFECPDCGVDVHAEIEWGMTIKHVAALEAWKE